MQDQDEERVSPSGGGSPPLMDRRKGPRRGSTDGEAVVERRGPDRRKRKPGLAGLFGAIFGEKDDGGE